MLGRALADLAAILAFAIVSSPLHGQERDRFRISVGVGPTFVTGTPERPKPEAGKWVTGAAGPSPGIHIRASAGWLLTDWFLVGAEGSYNRLTSANVSFNCLSNDEEVSPPTRTCYPAAKTDEVLAGLAVVRLEVPILLSPFLTFGAGAGAFRLEIDDYFEGIEGVEDTNEFEPVVRVGGGVGIPLGTVRLSLELSLNASLGRGGGSHHFPLVVSVAY